MSVSIAIPRENWHIFVDGAALRGEIADYVSRYFDASLSQIGYKPELAGPSGITRKIFYYDALPVIADGEDVEVFERRFQERSEELSRIARQLNTHVCTGMTRHRQNRKRAERKFEQKGVDVLLAVDVLRNAYGGVTENFLLVTGDVDFVPLIDQLISMGKNVVLAHPRRVSDMLLEAADRVQPIRDMWRNCIAWDDGLSARMPNWFRNEVRLLSTACFDLVTPRGEVLQIGKLDCEWIAESPDKHVAGQFSGWRGKDFRALVAALEDNGDLAFDDAKHLRSSHLNPR